MPNQFEHGRIRLKFTKEEVLANTPLYLEKLLQTCAVRDESNVPQKLFVAVQNGKVVGNINVRLDLNDYLRRAGGHIGYSVHPKFRGQGIATFMLQEIGKLLPKLGLKRAMLTADDSNYSSLKVMKKCHAVFVEDYKTEDTHKKKCWISAIDFESEIKLSDKEILKRAISESILFLESSEAEKCVKRDPYWPKWSNTWWHFLFLCELGLTHLIPKQIFIFFVEQISKHYLHFFPKNKSQLPEGCSEAHHVICHCALASAALVIFEFGENPLEKIPWLNQWIQKEALKNGGYNCDESAYNKSEQNSSFVANTIMLELFTKLYSVGIGENLVQQANLCAKWLAERNYYLRKSSQLPANEVWLNWFFPTAYEYHAYRGFAACSEWGALIGTIFPKLEHNSNYLKKNPLLQINTLRTLEENKRSLDQLLSNTWEPAQANSVLTSAAQKSVSMFFKNIAENRLKIIQLNP